MRKKFTRCVYDLGGGLFREMSSRAQPGGGPSKNINYSGSTCGWDKILWSLHTRSQTLCKEMCLWDASGSNSTPYMEGLVVVWVGMMTDTSYCGIFFNWRPERKWVLSNVLAGDEGREPKIRSLFWGSARLVLLTCEVSTLVWAMRGIHHVWHQSQCTPDSPQELASTHLHTQTSAPGEQVCCVLLGIKRSLIVDFAFKDSL